MSAAELQFLDTNILVYAYDSRAGVKAEQSQNLLRSLWLSKMGCLSVQVLQEFYVAATGIIKMEAQAASEIVSELSSWKIHTPLAKDILDAINVHRRYQISFWDALIVNSASKLDCAVLWSEDFSDGQVYEGVQVKNPFKE